MPCVCALLMCSAARANSVESLGTVSLRYKDTNPGGYARIQRPGYRRSNKVQAGQYNLELDPSYVPANPPDASNYLYASANNYEIGAFCADVREVAPNVSDFVEYNIVDLEDAPIGNGNIAMTADQADALRRLFGAYDGIWRDGVGDDELEAVAFALCVWEIVYETESTLDVSMDAGEFYALATFDKDGLRTTARDVANGWLSGVQTGNVPDIDLRVLANEGWQDYAIIIPGTRGGPPVVPEPMTMLGLMMGVGSLAGYIRKRKAG